MKKILGLLIMALGVTSCAHDFFNSSSLNSLSAKVQKDDGLKNFQQSRVATFETQYHAASYGGNVLTDRNTSTIEFSDQTVFLGYFIGWQAIKLWGLIRRTPYP